MGKHVHIIKQVASAEIEAESTSRPGHVLERLKLWNICDFSYLQTETLCCGVISVEMV